MCLLKKITFGVVRFKCYQKSRDISYSISRPFDKEREKVEKHSSSSKSVCRDGLVQGIL